MITIGADFGGPELHGTPIHKAISAAMQAEIKLIGDFNEGGAPAVNAVFYVPGSISRPDWEYSRVAKYSPKKKLVLVQIPVPEEQVYNEASLEYVIEGLYGANALAFEFYRQKSMKYPLADAEKLVARIQEEASKPSYRTPV